MRVAAATALVACLLAGCSTTDPGTPVPTEGPGTVTTTPAEPSEPTTPEPGAPTVADPLDVSAFAEDPCKAITSTQAGGLGVKYPGAGEPAAGGKACLWQNDSGGSVLLSVVTANGLSGVYSAKERGDLEVFEELSPIAGLPAVVANVVDQRERGKCMVWVGTSDQAMLGLALGQSSDKIGDRDPCVVAASVASQAITTIKEG